MSNKLIKYSYVENTSVVVDLIKSYVDNRTLEAIVGCLATSVYDDFLEYCKENNIRTIVGSNTFKLNLYRLYNLTTTPRKYNNNSVRIIIFK